MLSRLLPLIRLLSLGVLRRIRLREIPLRLPLVLSLLLSLVLPLLLSLILSPILVPALVGLLLLLLLSSLVCLRMLLRLCLLMLRDWRGVVSKEVRHLAVVVLFFLLYLLVRCLLLLVILIGLLVWFSCRSLLSPILGIGVLVLFLLSSVLNLHLQLVLVVFIIAVLLVVGLVHLLNLLRGSFGLPLGSAFFIGLTARGHRGIHGLRVLAALELEVRALVVESLADDLALEVDHGKDDFVQCISTIEVIDVHALCILADAVRSVFCLGHHSGGPVSLCKDNGRSCSESDAQAGCCH